MSPRRRLSERAFEGLSRLILTHPWWVVTVCGALSLVSIVYAGLRLQMKTDQNDLVSADLDYNRRYLRFLEEFGDLEFLYVVILVNGDTERAMRVSDAVAEEVSKLTDHVEAVFHRVPPESFGRSGLLLASRESIVQLRDAVLSNAARIREVASADTFARLLQALASALASDAGQLSSEAGAWGLRLIEEALGALAAGLRGQDAPSWTRNLVAASAAGRSPIEQGYLLSTNLELAFVEIMPKKNFETLEVIREPLARIREALERVRARFPGVELGLTGRPVLQADEMSTTNEDMTYSTVIAFFGVLFLFTFFFRRLRRPLIANIVLLVALGITFGFVTLTIGYLTLLSIVFAVMLVGLGVDFGVVLVARYQEELLRTGSVEESLRETLLTTGRGIWTGALTTGCAFVSSIFVQFKGLQELGFVAGTGLLICLLCMLTLLPALLLITDLRIQRHRVLHPPHPLTIPILAHTARHPRATFALFGVLTLAGLYKFQGIPYSGNLLDLQATGLESVRYELEIIKRSERSTWFAAFPRESLEGVDRTLEALRSAQQAGIVGAVESIRDVVPRDQLEKRALLEPAREVLAGIEAPEKPGAADPLALSEALEALLDGLDKLQSLAASGGKEEGRAAVLEIQGLIARTVEAQKALEDAGDGAAARVAAVDARWVADAATLRTELLGWLAPPLLEVGSLYPDLRKRLVSPDGTRFIVYAYPKENIWQEETMQAFIQAVRAVDPDVTGVPIQVYESSRLMHAGFLRAALYSLIMVFCILLVDLRDLRLVGITMIPVLLGVFWALELMPFLGLRFNLANFFGLPIMIGCGVDAGVHMVHRFLETGSTKEVGLTTGSAVTLANLSNLVGFASMGIAQHRGLASLGIVTALGCGTVLLASVVILPCLLELLRDMLLARRRAHGPDSSQLPVKSEHIPSRK